VNDLAAYLRQLRRAGYAVRLARSGHWKIRDPQGRLVAVTAATPSGPRTLAGLRADMRRSRREPAR